MATRPQSGQISSTRPQGGQISQTGHSKFIGFTGFEKMNTKVARQNLPDNQAAWIENLQPIAPNVLQAVPAALAALAAISGTVSRLFMANIGATDYIIAFTVGGAGIAINANSGAQTTFASAATFSALPDMALFASSRILIMDATGGYATWDGTLFVKSGGLSPNINVTAGGTGYSSAPSVTFSGGSGSGAAATAVVAGGAVVAVNLTNPGTGYLPTDAVTIAFGGPGTGAAATVRVWPQVKGTTITVFAGRVWWASGRLLSFTGTAGFDDTNPANAAGSTVITDSDLSHTITGLRSLNNFLDIFGDGAIKQIGSLTVQSSITLFSILTLASDIGTSFLMTILSYNRLVLFANKNGVYGIFGATVQKISDDLDGIFQYIDFTQHMSAANNDFHTAIVGGGPGGSIHCYMLLVRYNDPLTTPRSIMCVFQNNKWFIVSQGNLVAIVGGVLASTTQWEPFGSSGSDITHLLQDSATSVPILLRTALTAHQNPIIAKRPIRSGVSATAQSAQTLMLSVDTENRSLSYNLPVQTAMQWINSLGQFVNWVNNSSAQVVFIGGGFRFPYTDSEGYGKFIGNTITGTVANLAINMIANEYEEADL